MKTQRQKIKLLQVGKADEDDIIAARCRYRGTRQEYTRFSKAMDLPQQRERVTVDGLGNIGVGKWKKSNLDINLTKDLKSSKLQVNLQLFAKKLEDFETIWLPKQEYAHIMSEIATNLTNEQSQKKVFSKHIGDYIYTVENRGFGNYRVIKKIKIVEDL